MARLARAVVPESGAGQAVSGDLVMGGIIRTDSVCGD